MQEIAHLWPDPVERAEKAVVRKGRENYLCLLNFEEAAKRTALAPGQRSVALALIARWISSHTDGGGNQDEESRKLPECAGDRGERDAGDEVATRGN